MGTPDVSVVIPTHNRARLLMQTLSTILGQEGVTFEAIVVDDGSSDDTPTVLARCRDPRLRVLRREAAGGVGAARNVGIHAARGSWVAFVDDDDLWLPSKLARQLEATVEQAREWSYTAAVKFITDPCPSLWQRMPAPAPEAVAQGLPWKNVVPAGASNVMARRALLRDVGGFDVDLPHLADWDLWLKLLRAGMPSSIDAYLVAYRQHSASMSLRPEGILEDLRRIGERTQDLRNGAVLDPAPTHMWIAMSNLRAGRRRAAARSYGATWRSGDWRGLRGLLRAAGPIPPRPPESKRRIRAAPGAARELAAVQGWLRQVSADTRMGPTE
jgi:glycosyltransferase involved in cell wall biosynthesis